MSGNKYYIYIIEGNEIKKQYYVGQMSYARSRFSLEKYIYNDYNTIDYNHLEKKSLNKEKYSVFSDETINMMRQISVFKPINDDQSRAYDDMKKFLKFVDENLDLLRHSNIVLVTKHN